MYALLQPTSQSSPSHRHLSEVPSGSSPVSVWSPRCRPGHSCRGYNIPHWIAYQKYSVSLTLVNIEQRVHPDLKTTLMLSFLQTRLVTSLIPCSLHTIAISRKGSVASFGAAKRAIRESFLRKNRFFHQFAKVFSLESFPLYGSSLFSDVLHTLRRNSA